MSSLQQCLRPPARFFRSRTSASAASYLRFYNGGLRCVLFGTEACANNVQSIPEPLPERFDAHLSFGRELYPRFQKDADAAVTVMSCMTFLARYDFLVKGQVAEGTEISLQGRVNSIRTAGANLAFIDLVFNGHSVQAVCDRNRMVRSKPSGSHFRDFLRQLRRGDIYGVRGKAHRTASGQLSILVNDYPSLLAPCLHDLPTELQNPETRIRNRHVDLQVNQRAAHTLYLRSRIISEIRRYLMEQGFLEVQTPILAKSAGGAIARAFVTRAIEFPDRHIELRTAPELWLKRLVLGGLEKIFELGPSFRNEGIDKTHNPEFTTCEFYAAYQDLSALMNMTETMLSVLSGFSNQQIQGRARSLQICDIDFAQPYPRLDFIKEIESAIALGLPNLTDPDAEARLVEIFHTWSISLPEVVNLPRLLDRLSSEFLEPRCQAPTWIIHHPECLSPLSKSFVDPHSQQRVSARAELFIGGRELVNTYEEENSPFEQRRKFQEQIKYRDDTDKAVIDESYLQALEWGLPPTGGWGCGIDRLVMLLSGTDRINDVLPFGNLRNVVSLGPVGADSNKSATDHR
ncbi:MAG: hypothetical protein Q9216_004247 [Gyalolechia sp. 2 TL-2023]